MSDATARPTEITILRAPDGSFSFYDDAEGVYGATTGFLTFDQARHVAEERHSRWLVAIDPTAEDCAFDQRRFKLTD